MVFVKLFLYCHLLSAALVVAQQCWDGPRVCTPNSGCFYGKYMKGYKLDEFSAFLGIPYSQKPERFEPPVIYRVEKDHNATQAQSDCLQKNYLLPTRPVSGSEDCLYLNIYKQKATTEKLLPVMVYIFGGGFFTGTANPLITGPEYIMDTEKVVLVTINYRLGAFGFLATNDGVIPGNLGLKDQLCALQWIHENIAFFGGNKFMVTLFGQSAGAVSAHMHVLSPLSQNLFGGVIAMSGTANVPFAIDDDPDETARKTAKYCDIENWDTIDTAHLLDELKNVDANKLLDAGDHLKYWDVDNMVNYRPIVENPSPSAFLTKHPKEILSTGDYTPVPIMFGRVPGEGGVRVIAIMESDELKKEFNKNFYNLMVQFLEFPKKFNSSQIEEKMEYIIDEYFNGEQILNDDTRQGFMDLVTDRGFYHPLYSAIRMYVNTIDTNNFPLFMYRFNYKGPYTFATLYAGGPTKTDYGVVHCDDLIYMFRASVVFPDFEKESKEAQVIKYFVDDFINFAYYRKPLIGDQIEPCNNVTFNQQKGMICAYEEYDNDKNDFLVVNIKNKFNTKRMKFWDHILEEQSKP